MSRSVKDIIVDLYPAGAAASLAENGIIIVPPRIWHEAKAIADKEEREEMEKTK